MPSINLARPLTLPMEDGKLKTFAAGLHPDVAPYVADHWYTQKHLVQGDPNIDLGADVAVSTDPAVVTRLRADYDAAQARIAELADAYARLSEEHLQATQRIAELEAELDDATASGEAEGGESETGEAAGPYTIARGGQGSYKLMKDGVMVEAALSKTDAAAKAADLNAKVRAGEPV